MVPLPLQFQFLSAEIVRRNDALCLLPAYRAVHNLCDVSLLITQHWPSVHPSARHQYWYATYSASVLEDYAPPTAIRSIYDCSLTYSTVGIKFILKYDLLLPRACNLVSTIAHLAAHMSSWPANHKQVVASVMHNGTTALKQAVLFSITLEYPHIYACGIHIAQIILQLCHLASAVENINLIIDLVEEQRIIMKMPWT